MRLVAAVVVLLAGLVLAPSAGSADAAVVGGHVTKQEFERVKKGWTRERTEALFGAGRGRCAWRYGNGDGSTDVGWQYRNDRGYWTTIEYLRDRQGQTRVTSKSFNTQRASGFQGCH